MLTKQQVQDALRYNSGRVTKNLDLETLPWPWDSITGKEFVWATALFQCRQRLVVDGKLGPNTEKKIRLLYRAEDDTKVEVPTKRPAPLPVNDPKRFSNAVIVDGVRIVLPDSFIAAGITASNYLDDDEPHFNHSPRTEEVQHFVLHETCGNTADGCKNTLKKKGYGVQLILAPNGHLSCHGDLLNDRMVHANQLNGTSVGIEVVNPYAPQYIRDKAIWANIIPAEWWTWCPDKKDRRYVTPTPNQMAAIRLLAHWICHLTGIPYRFPTRGLSKRQRQIPGMDKKPRPKPGPGVVAHRDFAGHADGRYMLLDLIERAG